MKSGIMQALAGREHFDIVTINRLSGDLGSGPETVLTSFVASGESPSWSSRFSSGKGDELHDDRGKQTTKNMQIMP